MSIVSDRSTPVRQRMRSPAWINRSAAATRMATLIWPVRVMAMSGSRTTVQSSFHSSGARKPGRRETRITRKPTSWIKADRSAIRLDDVGVQQDDLGADLAGDRVRVADHASRQRLHVSSTSRGARLDLAVARTGRTRSETRARSGERRDRPVPRRLLAMPVSSSRIVFLPGMQQARAGSGSRPARVRHCFAS